MHAPGRPNRSIGPSLFIGFQALPTRVPRPVVQHVAAAVSCVVAALIHRHPCTGARPSSTPRPHIGCRHGVLHRRIVPSVVLVHHVVQSGEDEDAMLSAGREEGGPGFHRDVVAVLVPPLHPTPLEASPTDDAAVTIVLCRPPLPSYCVGSINGRVVAAGCVVPWVASVPCSPPRWIPFTDATHDSRVDPHLLPRPTANTATGGDPSPVA
jgi:hypothetical protein